MQALIILSGGWTIVMRMKIMTKILMKMMNNMRLRTKIWMKMANNMMNMLNNLKILTTILTIIKIECRIDNALVKQIQYHLVVIQWYPKSMFKKVSFRTGDKFFDH